MTVTNELLFSLRVQTFKKNTQKYLINGLRHFWIPVSIFFRILSLQLINTLALFISNMKKPQKVTIQYSQKILQLNIKSVLFPSYLIVAAMSLWITLVTAILKEKKKHGETWRNKVESEIKFEFLVWLFRHYATRELERKNVAQITH